MVRGEVDGAVRVLPEAERRTLLRAAYEGEIIGEAMYVSLEQLASTDHERNAARLLAELEKVTGDVLLPVVNRHGVEFDRDAAWQRGEDFTKGSMDAGWVAYFEKVAPLAEAALADMKRLHEASDEQDRAATSRLVAHEEAFLEFVHREVARSADSLAPLERYLHDPGEGGALRSVRDQ